MICEWAQRRRRKRGHDWLPYYDDQQDNRVVRAINIEREFLFFFSFPLVPWWSAGPVSFLFEFSCRLIEWKVHRSNPCLAIRTLFPLVFVERVCAGSRCSWFIDPSARSWQRGGRRRRRAVGGGKRRKGGRRTGANFKLDFVVGFQTANPRDRLAYDGAPAIGFFKYMKDMVVFCLSEFETSLLPFMISLSLSRVLLLLLPLSDFYSEAAFVFRPDEQTIETLTRGIHLRPS